MIFVVLLILNDYYFKISGRMKKLLLLLFSCFIFQVGFSQTNEAIDPARKAVYFGFKFGMNYSNMNFNKGYPRPAMAVESSWKSGFLFGFLLEVPLPHKLSLQQEYVYSRVNGENQSLNTQYNHSYLSLPLLLKYRLVPKVLIMAGPQFELLISAQEKVNEQTTNTTHDT